VIIFNFDVLARPAETLALRQPDLEGRYLWSMMHEKSRGRILLISYTEYDKDLFETWLKREQFKPSVYEFIDHKDPVLKAERVHTLASIWGKAQWYVDVDPLVCAETMRLGIPTLLVAVPYIIRPEWEASTGVRPWDNIITELDTQALKAANKTWGDM
jgi:hypothetical protein